MSLVYRIWVSRLMYVYYRIKSIYGGFLVRTGIGYKIDRMPVP